MEDGGAYCLGSEKTCSEEVSDWPYFTTSDERYHPNEIEATTIFDDEASVSPWAGDNFVYMPYCSQDGWLGNTTAKAFDKYYLRGSVIFRAIIREALAGQTLSSLEIVLVGSSSGALGVFNHIEWMVESMGLSVDQISVVLDSFYMPMSNLSPDSVSDSVIIYYYYKIVIYSFQIGIGGEVTNHNDRSSSEYDTLVRWHSLRTGV